MNYRDEMCPNCNGKLEIDEGAEGYYVKCMRKKCSAFGPNATTKEKAWRVWFRLTGQKAEQPFNFKLFHGGCHGCTQQSIHQSYRFCNGCQYRAPNWALPNLSNAASAEVKVETPKGPDLEKYELVKQVGLNCTEECDAFLHLKGYSPHICTFGCWGGNRHCAADPGKAKIYKLRAKPTSEPYHFYSDSISEVDLVKITREAGEGASVSINAARRRVRVQVVPRK